MAIWAPALRTGARSPVVTTDTLVRALDASERSWLGGGHNWRASLGTSVPTRLTAMPLDVAP